MEIKENIPKEEEEQKSFYIARKKRRIIQITPYTKGSNSALLFALCDDGTLWKLCMNDMTYSWEQINNVPQPEKKTEE